MDAGVRKARSNFKYVIPSSIVHILVILSLVGRVLAVFARAADELQSSSYSPSKVARYDLYNGAIAGALLVSDTSCHCLCITTSWQTYYEDILARSLP